MVLHGNWTNVINLLFDKIISKFGAILSANSQQSWRFPMLNFHVCKIQGRCLCKEGVFSNLLKKAFIY